MFVHSLRNFFKITCLATIAAVTFLITLGILRSTLEGPWVFEVEMRSTRPGVVCLLHDQGNGYNGSTSASVDVSPEFKTIRMSLPPLSVKKFRFDPLDGPGQIEIRATRLVNRLTERVMEIPLSSYRLGANISSFGLVNNALHIEVAEGSVDPQLEVDWAPSESLSSSSAFIFDALSQYWDRMLTSVVLWSALAGLIISTLFKGSNRCILPCSAAAALAAIMSPFVLVYFQSTAGPLEFEMRAPGSRFVTLRYGSAAEPERSSRVAVRPRPQSHRWDFKIEALGEKNSKSTDHRITMLQIGAPEGLVQTWAELHPEGGFKPVLTPSRFGPEGKLGIAYARGTISGTTSGSALQVLFLGGNSSGKVRVTVNGIADQIDLYSRNPQELFDLQYVDSDLGDDAWRRYSIALPSISIEHLAFSADSGTVEIRAPSLRGAILKPINSVKFGVELNRLRSAIFTFVSALVLGALAGIFVLLVRTPGERARTLSCLLISVIAALLWALVLYPGITDKDSIVQWESAITGEYYNWHPPLLAFLMRASLVVWPDPALLCFIGGTLYWFSILLVIKELLPRGIWTGVATAILLLNPILCIYSVSIANSTWAASAALFSTYYLIRTIRSGSLRNFAYSVGFIALAACFRHNYPTVAAVHAGIALIFLFNNHRAKFILKPAVAIAAFLLAVLPSKVLSNLPFVKDVPYAAGITVLNTYVGTLHGASLSPEERQSYQQEFDKQLGAGAFDRLQSHYICEDYFTYFASPEVLDGPSIVRESKFIVDQTVRVALKYPLSYLNHKLCWTRNFLHMDSIKYKELIGIELNRFNFYANSRLPELYPLFHDILEKPEYHSLYAVYIYFFAALALGVLALCFRYWELVLLELLSLAHFGGYFVTDVSACWRYTLYTYILSWIIILVSIASVARRLRGKRTA